MKHNFYKLLLLFLHVLVRSKRTFFSLFKKFLPVFEKAGLLYKETLGFWLYKFLFGIKRKASKIGITGNLLGFLGKRRTLQFVLFVVAILIMVPHSTLYTKEDSILPGRESILYKIVGKGEQDFDVEEVIADVSSIQTPENVRSWREAAVVLETGSAPQDIIIEKEGLGGISSGGTAIVKPTIISGAEIPTVEIKPTRSEIIFYEVQPGDVIGTIAQKFGLNTLTVLWANNLTSRSYIKPGDKLKILPTDGVLHTVAKGETIGKIANKYEVRESDIVSYNKLADASDINIGEELIIPGGKKPTITYTSTATSQKSIFREIAAPPPSVDSPAGSEFLWPTSARRITQYYGLRHTGLDIAGPLSTPLYASKSGKVIKSQCGWNGGYGCYVIIDHGGGVQTLYAHASKLIVSVGESVVQGQTVALMGSTGRSTGSHIHFEIRVNGVRENPLRYIR